MTRAWLHRPSPMVCSLCVLSITFTGSDGGRPQKVLSGLRRLLTSNLPPSPDPQRGPANKRHGDDGVKARREGGGQSQDTRNRAQDVGEILRENNEIGQNQRAERHQA